MSLTRLRVILEMYRYTCMNGMACDEVHSEMRQIVLEYSGQYSGIFEPYKELRGIKRALKELRNA